MSWLPWRTSHPVGRKKSAQSSESSTSDSWPPPCATPGMTCTEAHCPTCHSHHIDLTFRTWCATYLRCGDCGDMWTMRHHAEAEEKDDEAMHPRRRHTDHGLAV